jgi:hypothetical protein
MEYYLALCAATWVNIKCIMLNGISHTQKATHNSVSDDILEKAKL